MWKAQCRLAVWSPLGIFLLTSLTGCVTGLRKEQGREAPAKPAVSPATSALESPPEEAASNAQGQDIRGLMTAMTARIEALEGRLQTMNDRFDQINGKPKVSGVVAHPAESAGTEVRTALADRDPEAGYVNDGAVAAYREAMILFQAHKYAEARLGFSGFLEKYADHPLAGSAQYQIGETYFQMREYAPAIQEYLRVLTAYDRSPKVSDSLKRLAFCSDATKKHDEAARYRQLLTSMFPGSPAARDDSLINAVAGAGTPLKLPTEPAQSAAAKSGYDEPPPTANPDASSGESDKE